MLESYNEFALRCMDVIVSYTPAITFTAIVLAGLALVWILWIAIRRC